MHLLISAWVSPILEVYTQGPVLSQAQSTLRKTPARQERFWQLRKIARPQLENPPSLPHSKAGMTGNRKLAGPQGCQAALQG